MKTWKKTWKLELRRKRSTQRRYWFPSKWSTSGHSFCRWFFLNHTYFLKFVTSSQLQMYRNISCRSSKKGWIQLAIYILNRWICINVKQFNYLIIHYAYLWYNLLYVDTSWGKHSELHCSAMFQSNKINNQPAVFLGYEFIKRNEKPDVCFQSGSAADRRWGIGRFQV